MEVRVLSAILELQLGSWIRLHRFGFFAERGGLLALWNGEFFIGCLVLCVVCVGPNGVHLKSASMSE